jgi:hypothetical protein
MQLMARAFADHKRRKAAHPEHYEQDQGLLFKGVALSFVAPIMVLTLALFRPPSVRHQLCCWLGCWVGLQLGASVWQIGHRFSLWYRSRSRWLRIGLALLPAYSASTWLSTYCK